MKLNLRNKFLVPTLIMTIIGLGTTIFIADRSAQKSMRAEIAKELKQIVSFSESHVQTWITGIQQNIDSWAQIPEFKDLAKIQERPDTANRLLKSYKDRYEYFETVLIANASGDIIASANPGDIGKLNLRDRDYFQTTLQKGSAFSRVMRSGLSGNPVFTVTSRVSQGQTQGVLIAAVDLNYFNKQYIDPIKIGKTGYAYVLDPDGIVLAHPNKDMIMETNVAKKYDFGKSLLEGREGLLDYVYNGQEKEVAYQRVDGPDWIIAAGATLDELLAPIHAMSRMIMMVGAITLVIIGVVIFFIARSVANPVHAVIGDLQKGAEEVSAASGQVSASSQQLAEGASEQAASMEETSASLEEISSMTKQNADSTREVDRLLKEDVSPNFEVINERISNTRKALSKAVDASEETAKIIKTIDEIAFQTNLLALNAAVEAARAGEAGQGFAVVADEVRSLAQRAAEAAKQTSELIQNSNQQIKQSTDNSEQLTEAMEINGKLAVQITELVTEITAATQEQTDGIEQINVAVAQVDQVTQSIASNAEESAAASEELNAQAETMLSAVGRLHTIIEGSKDNRSMERGQVRPRSDSTRPHPSQNNVQNGKKGSGEKQNEKEEPSNPWRSRETAYEEAIPFDTGADDF